MIYLIDTSSLISLVRYYLPFDKHGILISKIKEEICENESLYIIDKVYKESSRVSKGIIFKKLDFLSDFKPFKTDNIIPDKNFHHLLSNDFKNATSFKKLKKKNPKNYQTLFENEKLSFIESADCKLILLADHLKNDPDKIPVIVTEETTSNNDNKLFKKIPNCCDFIDIHVISIADMLMHLDVEIDFK